RCGSQEFKTEDSKELVRRETVDPVWYHTFVWDFMLPPPQFQAYFPQARMKNTCVW
ncbi:unnamed protein product, partial [Discosporangium mesarthrocarpum]